MWVDYNMDSAVKNAADKRQVKRAKQSEEFRRENEIEDLRLVLGTPQGRRVIWRYLEICGVFKYGFQPDARYEAFVNGQRNIGGRIIADMAEVDPGLFGDISKEMKKGDIND